MPADSLVYVFGHGQFIQAARAIVADAHMDERAKMRAFWRKGEPPAISNAQRVGFHWQAGRWECAADRRLDQHPLHLVRRQVIGHRLDDTNIL
jgi:hypothetical protein